MSKKSASGSRASARERMRAERARQAEVARRRDRAIKLGIVGVVVLCLVAIGGLVWWQSSGDSSGSGGGAPEHVAWGHQAGDGEPGMGNGIGVGEADAPVVLEMYEDFMCPGCQGFELQAGPVIKEYVDAGQVRLVRYPMRLPSFGEPSHVAANGFACAVDTEGVDTAEEFGQEIYVQGSQGVQWDDEQLLSTAENYDLNSDEFQSCVEDQAFGDWLDSVGDNAAERGVSGTPTLFLNGERLPSFGEDGPDPVELVQTRIDQALEEAGVDPQHGDGQQGDGQQGEQQQGEQDQNGSGDAQGEAAEQGANQGAGTSDEATQDD